jgi:hypothetical protein
VLSIAYFILATALVATIVNIVDFVALGRTYHFLHELQRPSLASREAVAWLLVANRER